MSSILGDIDDNSSLQQSMRNVNNEVYFLLSKTEEYDKYIDSLDTVSM